MQRLLNVLPEFPGIVDVMEIHGGEVSFRVEHSEQGWLSLEWLSWCVSASYENEPDSPYGKISACAAPPYLNDPGHTLYFVLELNVDPGQLAARLFRQRETYIPVEKVPGFYERRA